MSRIKSVGAGALGSGFSAVISEPANLRNGAHDATPQLTRASNETRLQARIGGQQALNLRQAIAGRQHGVEPWFHRWRDARGLKPLGATERIRRNHPPEARRAKQTGDPLRIL